MKAASLALVLALFGAPAAQADLPDDPLRSPMWRDLAAKYFAGAPVVFDTSVKVVVPNITENQAQVPVTADARALTGVTQMIVFADLNPIQKILTLIPSNSAPYISFRMKVEQATPVRAAALTSDGTWHVGGVYLEAAGGGCTANALARTEENWSDKLGQTQGKAWREADGMTRVRLRTRHPMDTGLAKDNTPAYYIEQMDVRGSSGEPLAVLQTFEPLSEDPTMTLLLKLPAGDTSVEIEGRDNNGGTYKSSLPAPGRQSFLSAPHAAAAL